MSVEGSGTGGALRGMCLFCEKVWCENMQVGRCGKCNKSFHHACFLQKENLNWVRLTKGEQQQYTCPTCTFLRHMEKPVIGTRPADRSSVCPSGVQAGEIQLSDVNQPSCAASEEAGPTPAEIVDNVGQAVDMDGASRPASDGTMCTDSLPSTDAVVEMLRTNLATRCDAIYVAEQAGLGVTGTSHVVQGAGVGAGSAHSSTIMSQPSTSAGAPHNRLGMNVAAKSNLKRGRQCEELSDSHSECETIGSGEDSDLAENIDDGRNPYLKTPEAFRPASSKRRKGQRRQARNGKPRNVKESQEAPIPVPTQGHSAGHPGNPPAAAPRPAPRRVGSPLEIRYDEEQQRMEEDGFALVDSRRKVHQIGVFIKPVDEAQKLNSQNVTKTLEQVTRFIGKPIKGIRWTNKGELELKCPDLETAQRALQLAKIGNIAVRAYIPGRSSAVQGRIRGVDRYLPAESIQATLAEYGVVRATRETITTVDRDGRRQQQNLDSVILHFNTPAIPRFIVLGMNRHFVYDYQPVPAQCYKCQHFYHIARDCRGKVACRRCGGPHAYKDCKRAPRCALCKGGHWSSFKQCPKRAEIIQKHRDSCERERAPLDPQAKDMYDRCVRGVIPLNNYVDNSWYQAALTRRQELQARKGTEGTPPVRNSRDSNPVRTGTSFAQAASQGLNPALAQSRPSTSGTQARSTQVDRSILVAASTSTETDLLREPLLVTVPPPEAPRPAPVPGASSSAGSVPVAAHTGNNVARPNNLSGDVDSSQNNQLNSVGNQAENSASHPAVKRKVPRWLKKRNGSQGNRQSKKTAAGFNVNSIKKCVTLAITMAEAFKCTLSEGTSMYEMLTTVINLGKFLVNNNVIDTFTQLCT
jgi:hypothetical protein